MKDVPEPCVLTPSPLLLSNNTRNGHDLHWIQRSASGTHAGRTSWENGHRSTAEIANLISAEYLLDIDQAWVDRLLIILEKQKLVTK
jgi:hypothetical protein